MSIGLLERGLKGERDIDRERGGGGGGGVGVGRGAMNRAFRQI